MDRAEKNINDRSPCIEDGECTKSFPKEFFPETVMNHNGFPAYRRRDTGQTQPLVRNNRVYHVENRWVVQYPAKKSESDFYFFKHLVREK